MHNAKKYRKTRDYAIVADTHTHTHTHRARSQYAYTLTLISRFLFCSISFRQTNAGTQSMRSIYYCCIVTNTQQIVFVLLFRIFRSARVIKFVTRVWRTTQLHVNATQRKHNTAQRGTAPLNSTQFVGNAKLDATRLTAIVPLAGIASWLACWLTYWLAAWLLD